MLLLFAIKSNAGKSRKIIAVFVNTNKFNLFVLTITEVTLNTSCND
jgi:hypothetical protein